MPTKSAGSRVAHIPELPESILLHLAASDSVDTQVSSECVQTYPSSRSLRTVLLNQRVCKAFCDTIADSPKLQRDLFFAPPAITDVPSKSWQINTLVCFERENKRSIPIPNNLNLKLVVTEIPPLRKPQDGKPLSLEWLRGSVYRSDAPDTKSRDNKYDYQHRASPQSWRRMYLFDQSYIIKQRRSVIISSKVLSGDLMYHIIDFSGQESLVNPRAGDLSDATLLGSAN